MINEYRTTILVADPSRGVGRYDLAVPIRRKPQLEIVEQVVEPGDDGDASVLISSP